jgi:hypothetical protein
VIKFVSDLRQVNGFPRILSNKTNKQLNIPSQAFEAKALSIDFRALKSLTWKNKLFFLSLPIAFNSFKSILLPIPMENNVIPLFLASFAAAIV